MSRLKKVLVTGGGGFIGRNCVRLLSERGYEVHAVSSQSPRHDEGNVQWHQLNLMDVRRIPELISCVKPTFLLHLAWHVVPGKWTHSGSTENFLWVQSSLELLRVFHECGGKRVVMAGSCTEYDWKYGYCLEYDTPRSPNTFYGTCKNALYNVVDAYRKEFGISSAWGRIFFVYGPHEHPTRLVSSVILSLLQGHPARCTHGEQIRDYLYVADVAGAFVALLESDVTGAVNIGSGRAVALKDIVYKIAHKLHRENLVQLGAVPALPTEAPIVVADVSRLTNEVGWRPQYEWDNGLERTIGWWKEQLDTRGAGEE